MEDHMDWILSVANIVRSKFYDRRIEELISDYLKTDDTHSIITKTILNESTASFFIIASNPKKVFYNIIDRIKKDASENEKLLFKPITIITKLANREFMMDINGERVIYGINAKYSNDALVKSLLCRSMYSIKNYFTLENFDAIGLKKDGGRIKKNKHAKNYSILPRVNIKINILSRLIKYVKANTTLMGSIIYLNNLSDVDNHALDIIYSDNRSKEAIIDYLKIFIAQEYKDYSFEHNAHQGFFVPYDFRIRKFSCFMRHGKTKQNNYLVNLYNSATYEPIPCFRLRENLSTCQLIAHPLTKLRFLYLDLYFLNATNAFTPILERMIESAYSELSLDKNPIWVGVYKDENYDRNQENMRSNVEVPFEVIII